MSQLLDTLVEVVENRYDFSLNREIRPLLDKLTAFELGMLAAAIEKNNIYIDDEYYTMNVENIVIGFVLGLRYVREGTI